MVNRWDATKGAEKRSLLFNIIYEQTNKPKPIVFFIHGFKGFKDWGSFPLVTRSLARAGFVSVPMNFSHNGTTAKYPLDFVDLEAFGNNNFTKEMDDICAVLKVLPERLPPKEADFDNIFIIGHSRGGAISIIAAYEIPEIKKVVTWASVVKLGFDNLTPEEILEWKRTGVRYIWNARTLQQMPLFYQIYEDYQNNKERFQLESIIKQLKKPIMIIHGTADDSVPCLAAEQLKAWQSRIELLLIEGANHTFGASHPFNGTELPLELEKALNATILFLHEQ